MRLRLSTSTAVVCFVASAVARAQTAEAPTAGYPAAPADPGQAPRSPAPQAQGQTGTPPSQQAPAPQQVPAPQQAPAPQQGYAPQGAPPGYGPHGGYAPPPAPGYGPTWGPGGYGRPAIMPYHEGDPMPPGYHVEERIRMGPFITGLAIGGTFYALSVAVAAGDDFENQKGWLLVPGLGPFITLAARDDGCDATTVSSSTTARELNDCAYEASGAKTLLVLDGILQATGVLLVGIGVAVPRTVLVRDDTAELRVTPMRVGRRGHGLGLTGRF